MKTRIFALLGAAACAAPHAGAQESDPQQVTLPRVVVVTPAQGVAEKAFDTPASVDVIEGATLRNSQLQVNLSESLVRVPGVVALNRQNYAQDLQISSRGFGARSTFGVRGLRLFVDGIPATAPDGQGQVSHIDLASAGRIEILRGPFSVLYGNASGGVISVVTADGGPETVAEAGAAFGSDDVRRVNARLSGELGALQYNVSAMRFETGGWRDHSAAQRTGFNGKFRYRFSQDTRVTFLLNSVAMPDVQDPLGLTRSELQADPKQASPSSLQFNTRKSVDQLQAGAVLEHRINPVHSLKLATWGSTRNTEQFQAIPVGTQAPPTHPGGVIDLDRGDRGLDAQWVARMRLMDHAFTVTAGVAGDELKEHRRGFQNFVGTTLGITGALRRDEDNRVRSFDQYLHALWSTGGVSLSAGLRHTQVRFRSLDRYVAPGNGDDSGSAQYGATTPAFGAVLHATDTLNVYAAYGRGFETPTFNELSYRPGGAPGLNFDLRGAHSRQWEAGVKSEPLPGWQANAAVFEARTNDELVVLSNTGGRSTFQNAGKTRRKGAEATLSGRFGEGWSAAAALTWLDATYASGFNTCTAAPCAVPTVLVPAGSRIPGIPRTSAFAELAWRHRPWGLETALEWRYIGRMTVDDRNTDHAPAASILGVRLSLEQAGSGWTVREFVRVDNVADRRYVGSVIVNEGNRRFFEPAPGRTWLIGVNASRTF